MESAARFLLTVKKWFGIVTTISWLIFLAALCASIVLHAFGTVMQQIDRNVFEHSSGLFAGGLPLLFMFAMIYYFPVNSDKPFMDSLLGAAGKSAIAIGVIALAIAMVAAVLGILSEPIVEFARWLLRVLWPLGKTISSAFTGIWVLLLVACLVLLIRIRSFTLAIEIVIELVKESVKEIFEFYREIFEFLFDRNAI